MGCATACAIAWCPAVCHAATRLEESGYDRAVQRSRKVRDVRAAARSQPLRCLLLLACLGCGRGSDAASARRPSTQAAPAQLRAPEPPAPPRPNPARIVAVGDLHGDLHATRAVLQLAGLLDASGSWSGGATVLVQTGDQLDRGDDEPDILALLARLEQQARAAGGEVVVLNGNHELMNVARDFRYVTADGFADYAAGVPASDDRGVGRARAYAPGGQVARELARRPVTARVGDTLFAHGGVLESHVRYGLSRIDREVAQWMLGARPTPPPIVMGEDSPVWTRVYSNGTPRPEHCEQLARVLRAVGAKRLVVGHTVQARGINSACDGRVFRIDVGMARAYGGPVQALELRGDSATVLGTAE